MNPLLAGALAGGMFFAGAAFMLFYGDTDGVSIECAAAHVTAMVVQNEYATSTHGIPNWQTDDFRDEVFYDASQRVKDACGGFTEPYDLWWTYEDAIREITLASLDHENPERRPWYREVICPTLDDAEEIGLCQEATP